MSAARRYLVCRPCLGLFCLVVARSCLRGGSWWRSRLVALWSALVPSWQGVARRRTRSERGKADKG